MRDIARLRGHGDIAVGARDCGTPNSRESAMKRREFLKSAGLGLAASTVVAAPAIAQSMPEIKWRLTASWPKSLDTLWGACETFTKYVSEASDGKFQIQPFAAGEIVPGLQTLDAVQNGTVEMGHTAYYYYIGKDPTWALFCSVPFGLNARQQNAWFYEGDGQKLIDEFGAKFNTYNVLMGNTGTQMGGWFRKEIKSVEDFKGLKMRIGGWAGKTLAQLGVIAQQIPGGDIYPALEKGTIDATEWVGPYDDEKLGFYKVAKYYYYPGWWEGQTQAVTYVNIGQWNQLPKSYQAILTAACAEAYGQMLGKYDTDNVAALRRLVANGAQLRPFSKEILDAAYKAAYEFYDETAAKNPKWKAIYEPWKKFLDDEHQWFRVNEQQFDNYMLSVKKS